ncbi:major facilitator superfamily protein [Streptococcus varani]|uniref:Major facilitator superfamily protein n=1 Tax=Streptococcus varani TaxID=1608583 RepID=A0A0E4H5B4_9STRE|nr:MFS transporter [Streptococcus varani]CQR25943.1 major facilitator superfamily protein [Streptococcus varani]
MKQIKGLKIALLSTSLFIMSHLAIAPAIPDLYTFYHAKDPSITLVSVETLVTIPAMMILLAVIFSNLLIAKIGKKKTVELGLSLIFLSGLLSFFATNFQLVFIGRLLLGFGIGIYNPLSISMISDYFDKESRSAMIGMRTATLNIGKTLTTFLVGYALLLGTRYIFLIYILVLPVLFLFHYFVIDIPVQEKRLTKVVVFDQEAVLWMLITLLIGIAYIGATIKIPTLLVNHYAYNQFDASRLLVVLAFSGILLGLVFGTISKVMKSYTLPLMLLLMALGNLLFVFGNHLPLFYLGAILIGASFVGGMSAIFDGMAIHYPKEQLTFVTSMAITAGNIGVIVSPLILTKLVARLSWEMFVTPFYITAGAMFLSLVFFLFLRKKEIS